MNDQVKNPDFMLENYNFELPQERIAQYPAMDRAASRLMVLDRGTGQTTQCTFTDILKHLPEDCLLVANNSRVIPARVPGFRPEGGKMELLLLTPVPLLEVRERNITDGLGKSYEAEAEILLKPSKKFRIGEFIHFSDDFGVELLNKRDFGRCHVRLQWQGNLHSVLERRGQMPLPPYIHRSSEPTDVNAGEQDDFERYQTIYARTDKAGSVAAPTAGLHFTPKLRKALADTGRDWAEVTLYVGYGTFSPVRCPDIREHPMHAEYVELSRQTADSISRAKAQGRPIVAIGTTSARVLEGVFLSQKGNAKAIAPLAESGHAPQFTLEEETFLAPHKGWINIFLYPGKAFNVIDGLITNFHLPESSLLMLVSALAGRKRVIEAYREAVEAKFRFFSYGDAMLII